MDTSHLLYASDLTDANGRCSSRSCHPSRRSVALVCTRCGPILNAIFYQLRTGGAWRFLPQEWPPWQTVYHYLRRWRLGRDVGADPHAAARAAARPLGAGSPAQRWQHRQSIGEDHRRRRAAWLRWRQEVNGRKRHLLVDTEGLLLRAVVHPADIMDRDGVKLVLRAGVRTQFPRLRHLWLDAGYNGKGQRQGLDRADVGWTAQIVPHPRATRSSGSRTTFHPSRSTGPSTCRRPASACSHAGGWWNERSLGKASNRRLSKDYERLCATSETWIYLAMIRLMLRRLARFWEGFQTVSHPSPEFRPRVRP